MELSSPIGISPSVPQDQRSFFGVLSHIINPLLTRLFGQDGWILASSFSLRVCGPRLRLGR